MDENLKRLESYLISKYELVELSGYIKKKLSNAFNSEVHVDPAHLLDLWKMMEPNLHQARAKNTASGRKMEGFELLNYELAIILNHYPRYIKKINEIEKQQKDARDMMDFMSMVGNIKSQPPKHELTNVSDMVDEIFFSDSE